MRTTIAGGVTRSGLAASHGTADSPVRSTSGEARYAAAGSGNPARSRSPSSARTRKLPDASAEPDLRYGNATSKHCTIGSQRIICRTGAGMRWRASVPATQDRHSRGFGHHGGVRPADRWKHEHTTVQVDQDAAPLVGVLRGDPSPGRAVEARHRDRARWTHHRVQTTHHHLEQRQPEPMRGNRSSMLRSSPRRTCRSRCDASELGSCGTTVMYGLYWSTRRPITTTRR